MDRSARYTALVTAAVLTLLGTRGAAAPVLPAGFQDSVVWGGHTLPVAVRFAPDGKVFVAEKRGLIWVYDSVADPTGTVFADLRTEVMDYWDRGLLGLAVDPEWPTRPYVYALYTRDALPGGAAPHWNDSCPDPPGGTRDGCVATGRLVRLTADGDSAIGETILLQDWCQQYPSHSIADVTFGEDGALYVSAGDGASFNWVDYGQGGASAGSPTPKNPCGDPPGDVGDTLSPPSAEGGALRSQDILTPGDPQTFDGTVLRIDPDTGEALPDNPLYGGAVADDDRIIAYGLRNPFRIAARPGTDEIWLGDVGWTRWEELNAIRTPTASVENFGWPCYEGYGRQAGYDGADLALCELLYGSVGAVTEPIFAYDHQAKAYPGDTCGQGSSAVSGVAFYQGGGYPGVYQDAVFFADYARRCVWMIFAGPDGEPDPATIGTFISDAATPVDLQIGPGGDLFYADIAGGTIHRVTYASANQPPVAVLDADPESGAAPLDVDFDASASFDPDGDALTYDWDLDGDGVFGDATGATAARTYPDPGGVVVTVRVTDPFGERTSASVTLSVDDTPPVATILDPPLGLTWRVGDPIPFAGSATDDQDGTLPPAAFSWTVQLFHCYPDNPSDCHIHTVQTIDGVASGSFPAPDHEYPAHVVLQLTVTDSAGLTDQVSLDLYPETVIVDLVSDPPGLDLALNGASHAAPWQRDVIARSLNSVSATSPQTLGGAEYVFAGWSDGGGASHDVTAGDDDFALVASYALACPGQPGCALSCPSDDGWEDNESRLAAAPIPTGEGVAAIACPDDSDWYSFGVVAGCDIAVTAAFTHAEGDLHLQLFDPAGVQVAASYSGTDDESVSTTAAVSGAYAVHVYGFQGASNDYTLTAAVTCAPNVETDCENGADDDGDGLVDCADPDCAGGVGCVLPSEDCDNGVDDDEDGLTDCDDDDCAGATVCIPRETLCDNDIDDDGDGATDCDDVDCAGAAGCPAQCPTDDAFEDNDSSAAAFDLGGERAFAAVACQNDDDWYRFPAAAGCTVAVDALFTHADGDLHLQLFGPGGGQLGASYSSSDDESVVAVATQTGLHAVHVWGFQGAENGYLLSVALTCPGDVETACADGLDDDGDGLVDCDDGDCAADAACIVLPEDCDDGADNDRDGQVDCDDADCAGDPVCAPTEGDCGDGVDDDGDGLTDCDDLDCLGAPGCPAACPADDGFEQNDFQLTAAPVTAGVAVDAVVCANDADWFAVDADAGCAITVDLRFVHADGDLHVQLKAPDGSQLGAAYSASDDELVLATTSQSGPHAVHVYGFQGAENRYALTVAVDCPEPLRGATTFDRDRFGDGTLRLLPKTTAPRLESRRRLGPRHDLRRPVPARRALR